MSMTAQVKAELAQLPISKECCLRAETVTLLRLCSALQIRDGKPLVEVELDSLAAAERLRRSLHALYGHQSLLITPPPSSGKAALSYVVRVEKGAARLGKQTGLVDGSGRLVTGLVDSAWPSLVDGNLLPRPRGRPRFGRVGTSSIDCSQG